MSSRTNTNKIKSLSSRIKNRIDSLSKWGSDKIWRTSDMQLLKEIDQVLEELDQKGVL